MEDQGRPRRRGGSVRATAAVFRQRPLRAAIAAFGLASTGSWAFTVALGLVSFEDAGAAGVGVVSALRMGLAAAAGPLLSPYADRFRRERFLVVVSVTEAAAMGGSAVVLGLGGDVRFVYVLAVVDAVAATMLRPVHSALLPRLCATTAELTGATVARGFVESLATVAGPATAGILLAASGASAVFAAAAALSAAAAAVMLTVHSDSVGSTTRARLGRESLEGLATVARHPDLRLIFCAGFAQTAVRGALTVFTIVVPLEALHAGDPGVAALAAALGVGGIAGSLGASLIVGSRHLGVWLAVALVGWGLPITGLGVAPDLAVACSLVAAVGAANAVIDIPFYTLPVRLVPDALLARVFGAFESVVALGMATGSIVAPALLSWLGLRLGIACVGGLLPLLAAVLLPRLVALDGRLTVREEEIAVLRANPVLGLLPVAGIEQLAQRLEEVEVAAGAQLFAQGDPAASFYVVADGEVEVIGDGVLRRRMGPGDCFGEVALLAGSTRTATVRSVTGARLFAVDRDSFLDVVTGHAVSRTAAHDVVARRLADFAPSPDPDPPLGPTE